MKIYIFKNWINDSKLGTREFNAFLYCLSWFETKMMSFPVFSIRISNNSIQAKSKIDKNLLFSVETPYIQISFLKK